MQDIVSESYTDKSKRFWSYFKSKGKGSMGVAPLKNKQGFLQSDNQCKADILNEQFTSVFTREDPRHIPDKGPSPYLAMPDILNSQKGVQKLLKDLNPNKATGPDQIPTRFLKMVGRGTSSITGKVLPVFHWYRRSTSRMESCQCGPNFQEGGQTPAFKLLASIAHSCGVQNSGTHSSQ